MRRARILAAFAALCLVLLTACSKAAPVRTEAPASKVRTGGDITTVVIGLVQWEDTPVINEMIRAFQEEHPAIRIEKRIMQDGSEADPLLRNQKVDLVSALTVRDLSRVRLVQPLDPYIARSQLDWKGLGRMDELQIDGAIYDLPYYLSPFLLLYNPGVCEAAGVGVPAKTWTWDDLRDAAQKAAHGQGTDRVWGYAPSSATWWEFELYVLGQTADLRWWANGPGVQRGLQYFGGLIQTDGSAPRVPKADPPVEDPAHAVSPFLKNAALAVIQVPNLTILSQAEQKYGVNLGLAPTPLTPGMPPIMGARPTTLAMAAGSPVQDAAWSFLEFSAGPKGAAIAAQLGYMPAYRTPALMQQWLQKQTARTDGLDDLINREVRLIKDDDATSTPQQRMVVREAAANVFSGQMKPEEAFVRYQDALPKPR